MLSTADEGMDDMLSTADEGMDDMLSTADEGVDNICYILLMRVWMTYAIYC